MNSYRVLCEAYDSNYLIEAMTAGDTGATVGSIAGAGLGAYAGSKLANHLTKTSERNEIKQIILMSENPEDCINKLSNLNTEKAGFYIKKVQMHGRFPDWKQRVIEEIRSKNLATTAIGSIGGGYVGWLGGNRLGRMAGDELFKHFNKTTKTNPVPKVLAVKTNTNPAVQAAAPTTQTNTTVQVPTTSVTPKKSYYSMDNPEYNHAMKNWYDDMQEIGY